MKYRKLLLFFVFFIAIFIGFNANASTIDAPTIVEANTLRDIDGIQNFFVTGLTVANTEVLVYLDGKFVDLANVSSGNKETESFYYSFPNTVISRGKGITLVSRDKTSLVLSSPVEIKLSIPDLPAPTLVSPDESFVSGHPRPYITGLSVSNTFVHIYIDGVYNGKTEIIKHESGTANFAYKPYLNLNVGNHSVSLQAETKDGLISKKSDIFTFRIEEPMPAPILLLPEENKNTNVTPVIAGLSKNNTKIKIFVDHKIVGTIDAVNNLSTTANFNYKVEKPLERGSHFVYATAQDPRGKESIWSNIVYFTVKSPEISISAETENISSPSSEAISSTDKTSDELSGTVVTDNKEVNPCAPNNCEDSKKDEVIVVDSSGEKIDINKEITDDDIKKLLEEETSTSNEKKGLVNEDNKLTGKLNWNLVIFIVFLLGVIAWIFWVNKELIKERNNDEDKDME